MNKTKTNSHFLPTEKLFLLFTFSSPLPSLLQCTQDGIAGGKQRQPVPSSRQGEQGWPGRGGPAQPQGWRRGEAAGVPVSIPMPAKAILSSYQQLCTMTQLYSSRCHHCQQL